MTRGNAAQTKVHYKGKEDDYVIFAESAQAVRDWKKDKTVPLAQVVNGFKIFITHKHGAQGILDTASKGQLESEFGTHRDEEVIIQIIEKGSIIESEEHGKHGDRNITGGPSVAH